MLGMTDFSLIPSFLIDGAYLLHGSSSLQQTGGGLGGAVILNSGTLEKEGLGLQYIQGLGSFRTADEFVKLSWRKGKLQSSTRFLLSSSENRFKFVNRDKNELIYDEEMNVIGKYHPVEEFDNGAFRDLHIMQNLSWDAAPGHSLKASVWYVNSFRELPQLSVDYSDRNDYINEQREKTLRAVLNWSGKFPSGKAEAAAGYAGTGLGYDYARNNGDAGINWLTRSRSESNTVFAKAGVEAFAGSRWMIEGNVHIIYNQLIHKTLQRWSQTGAKILTAPVEENCPHLYHSNGNRYGLPGYPFPFARTYMENSSPPSFLH